MILDWLRSPGWVLIFQVCSEGVLLRGSYSVLFLSNGRTENVCHSQWSHGMVKASLLTLALNYCSGHTYFLYVLELEHFCCPATQFDRIRYVSVKYSINPAGMSVCMPDVSYKHIGKPLKVFACDGQHRDTIKIVHQWSRICSGTLEHP